MVYDFLRQLLRFFILYLIRPVLLLCGALISSVYNALFAWWLDPWTFKRRQTRFEHEIQAEYSWFFDEYDARIVPMKRYRRAFDYVMATVALGDLLLRFVKGRAEFRVDIAPAHAPNDWHDFAEAIDLASDAESVRSGARSYRMANFRQLFEANFERLKLFFSAEEYGESRRERTVKKLIPP
jgi:thiosulfate reductase cytochrome b subunit